MDTTQKACPICKLGGQKIKIWDAGERSSVECTRCGKFTITGTAVSMAKSKKISPKLSAWIRERTESGAELPEEICSEKLKEIEAKLPSYGVAEKQLILLRAFEKRTQFPGQYLSVNSQFDYPLAWAENAEEFCYLLHSLPERNLICIMDEKFGIGDSLDFKIQITPKGWELLEKESSSMEHKNNNKIYDIFISHASEDKDDIARPLYNALKERGVSVWFDEAVLKLGDSLRRKIDEGLSKCRYGVVILSPKFLSKQWPQRELDGLVARETASGKKAILPIWHNLDRDTLLRYSPPLADKLAGRSEDGVSELVEKIIQVLN